jgi:hypothetical protein
MAVVPKSFGHDASVVRATVPKLFMDQRAQRLPEEARIHHRQSKTTARETRYQSEQCIGSSQSHVKNDEGCDRTDPYSLLRRSMETAIATQSVLAAGLPMIMEAIADPIGADHRELAQMVTEKVSAFSDSHEALTAAGKAMHRTGGINAAAFCRLAGGGMIDPTEWTSILERNLALAAVLMSLPMQAMAPLHSGVTANARRLRKRRAS